MFTVKRHGIVFMWFVKSMLRIISNMDEKNVRDDFVGFVSILNKGKFVACLVTQGTLLILLSMLTKALGCG